MARVVPTGAATPWAVCVRYTFPTGSTTDHITHHRKTLTAALDDITAANLSLVRLLGAQAIPLEFLVIDQRDYVEWHEGTHPLGAHENARKIKGHWYHKRDRGTVVGAPRRRFGRVRKDPTHYLTG